MIHQLRAFAHNDGGNATVEYSVVIVAFAVTLIGALQVFFGQTSSQLTSTQMQLAATSLTPPSP